MTTVAAVGRLATEVGELLAKHEKRKGIHHFEKYADDPAGFMHDVLRCHPWEKQVEMAEMVRDNRFSIAVTCNSLGKDWAAARIALWWTYARRGYVIITGPTERQVKNICFGEIRRAFALAPDLPGDLYSLELRVDEKEQMGIIGMTSNEADKLTGFHHPRLLVLITEGQQVEDYTYEAAQACCTDSGNHIFVYGNPTRPTGKFFKSAHSDNWECLTIPASAHPNVITGRAEIPGSVSREWIAAMREEYGEGSSIYRSRVLAQFPDESIEGLIKRDWFRAAVARTGDKAFLPGDRRVMATPLMAIDVARFGPDASVLAVARGPMVVELIKWRGASITETAEKVIAHGKRIQASDYYERLPVCWVDEPGLGGGLVDVLNSKGYPVKAFNGAEASYESDRFLNKRAEVFWHFRTILENNRCALPDDATLEEEAMAVEWSINPSRGCIQIVGKDILRKTLQRSPDALDAVVIALAASMDGFKRFQSGGGALV